MLDALETARDRLEESSAMVERGAYAIDLLVEILELQKATEKVVRLAFAHYLKTFVVNALKLGEGRSAFEEALRATEAVQRI